jgi:RND family efflux transporter MFP subunit
MTLAAVLLGLGALVTWRLSVQFGTRAAPGRGHPVAIEVAPIERGAIEQRRSFTGTLDARGRFVVAANVGGRVERLFVDLADPVRQGQVVAELDDAEESAGVAEAAAELGVLRANLAEAESGLEIAERQLERTKALHRDGLVADTDLDLAQSQHLASKTKLAVAKAELRQGTAVHRRAHVRSGYTKVIASWSGDAKTRVVAERHVAEGDTVAPQDPLVKVVDVAPLIAVIHVTERDYAKLRPDQQGMLTTEAYPGRTFPAVIRRIAPVFRQSSRQARMELEVANADGQLKPGMFVRAELVVARAEEATIVPLAALADRAGETGVFVVDDAGSRVAWHAVRVGIEQDERVELLGSELRGRVVTLGHQLLDDGSAVTIPAPAAGRASEKP